MRGPFIGVSVVWLVAALLIPAAVSAQVQPASKAAAKRNEGFLRAAMTRPMADLLAGATAIQAQDDLAYGLALQLGRPPATAGLTSEAQAALEADTLRARTFYLKARPAPEGDTPLVETPDFWTFIAAGLYGHIDVNRAFSDEFRVTRDVLFADEVQALANRQELTTHKMLDTKDVATSQTCAIYARAGAALRVTGDTQPPAARAYDEMARAGAKACGGKAFFDEVSAFAQANLKP